MAATSSVGGDRAGSFYLPIDDATAVEVKLGELPDDTTKLVNALIWTAAPLDMWLRFAVEYYKRGQVEQAVEILEVTQEDDVKIKYNTPEHQPARFAIRIALAAHHTNQGVSELDNAKRNAEFVSATGYLNENATLDSNDTYTWLGVAFLNMAKASIGSQDEKQQKQMQQTIFTSLDNAVHLDHAKVNVQALIGKAVMLFHRKKYSAALKLYKKALEMNPALPASVRLGIGMCHIAKGDSALAERAFKRVLQLEPDNVQALVAMATLDLNARKLEAFKEKERLRREEQRAAQMDDDADEELERLEKEKERKAKHAQSQQSRLVSALVRLEKAYEVDPTDPMALVGLGHILFYKGERDTAVKLGQRALEHSGRSEPVMAAQARYILGREAQSAKQFDKALELYRQAAMDDPTHLPTQLGLGQLYAMSPSTSKQAIECLTRVHAVYPRDYTVLRVLGAVLAAKGDAKGIAMLEEALGMCPKDGMLLLDIAKSTQQHYPQKAYTAYSRVLKLLKTQGKAIAPELWTNFGGVCHVLGKHRQARLCYGSALGIRGNGMSQQDFTTMDVQPGQVTACYNLAVTMEAQRDFTKANELHRAILRRFPSYVDSKLRLGAMHEQAGRLEEAETTYKDAITQDETGTAQCHLAALLRKKGDTEGARKAYKEASQKKDSKPLALLGLGVLRFERAMDDEQTTKRKWLQAAAAGKKMKPLKLRPEAYAGAGTYFKRLLEAEPDSARAAVGLGVVLAQQGKIELQQGKSDALHGKIEAARKILQLVKEKASASSDKVLDASFNLAHLLSHPGPLQNLNSATKLYESVLAASPGSADKEVLTCLCHAYYHNGMLTKCKATLLRAVHLWPTDARLWYNLALAQEETAIKVLQTSKTGRKYRDVKQALTELEQALQTFKRLATAKENGTAGVDADTSARAKRHANFCQDSLAKARPHLEHAEKMARQDSERARRATEARERILREQREREEQKRKEEEERKKKLEEQAAKNKLDLAAAIEVLADAQRNSSGGGRSGEPEGEDLDDMDKLNEDGGPDAAEEDEDFTPGMKLAEEMEPAPAVAGADEADALEAELFGSDDDDDNDAASAVPEKKEEKKKKRKKGKLKRKRLSEDDEEEQGGEVAAAAASSEQQDSQGGKNEGGGSQASAEASGEGGKNKRRKRLRKLVGDSDDEDEEEEGGDKAASAPAPAPAPVAIESTQQAMDTLPLASKKAGDAAPDAMEDDA